MGFGSETATLASTDPRPCRGVAPRPKSQVGQADPDRFILGRSRRPRETPALSGGNQDARRQAPRHERGRSIHHDPIRRRSDLGRGILGSDAIAVAGGKLCRSAKRLA